MMILSKGMIFQQWVFGRAMKNFPENKNKVTGVPHKKVSE